MKYLSSIYLFVTNPTQHEGILHIARQKIISNKALLVYADKSGLPQYIQSKPFMPKMWSPRGYSILKPVTKTSALHKDSGKNCPLDTKEEPPAGGEIETLVKAVAQTSDTQMAYAKDLVDLSKGREENEISAIKHKRSLYDDDYQWLGDKAGIFILSRSAIDLSAVCRGCGRSHNWCSIPNSGPWSRSQSGQVSTHSFAVYRKLGRLFS